jgi:hypothetical protein
MAEWRDRAASDKFSAIAVALIEAKHPRAFEREEDAAAALGLVGEPP